MINNVTKIIIYLIFIFIKGGNPFPNPLCTRRSWGMRPGRFCGSLIDLPAPAPPYNFYTKLLFCSLYHCILRAHTKPPYIFFPLHRNPDPSKYWNPTKDEYLDPTKTAMIWIKGKVSYQHKICKWSSSLQMVFLNIRLNHQKRSDWHELKLAKKSVSELNFCGEVVLVPISAMA